MKPIRGVLFFATLLLSLNLGAAEIKPLKATIHTYAENTPAAEAITPPSDKPLTTPATNGAKLWNLQDADILSIINEVSQETGKNFIIDPRVQGKISLVSSKPIKPEDVYEVFLNILGLLGYSAISNDNVIKIVPNLESSELATRVASSQSPGKGDEIVVRVISLEHVSANQLIPVLRPLLPQWSNISAYMPGNVLIIAGQAANLKRITQIIRDVDKASSNDIDIVPLRYASATQTANVLNNLQNASRASGETPSVFITADERTNSILLSGNKSARLRTHIIVSQLDTPSSAAHGNIQVIYLRYLQAKTLAPILSKIADNLLGKAVEPKDSKEPSMTVSPLPALINSAILGNQNQAKNPNAAANLTNIQAEPNTNAIIISAPPSLMQALTSIIAKLDVRPAQVHVEGIIVEINQDQLKNLGITWGTTSSAGVSVSSTDSTISSSDTSITPSQFSFPPLGAGIVGLIPQQNIKAVLSLLENKTGVNILSTPSIVVLDNQKAVLEVGQEVPWQTGSYSTTGSTSTVTPFNTFEQKPVTLKLTVTPQINLGNAVRLKINLKNDSLQNPENPGINPIINTSTINNSVVIESGDILVIGGLISNNISESVNKIPLLGDLPILGHLFQNKSHSLQRRNLVMFIRPVILHDAIDSLAITNTKYDAIRNTQINWPVNLTNVGEQKRKNILPLLKKQAVLPTPFGNDAE